MALTYKAMILSGSPDLRKMQVQVRLPGGKVVIRHLINMKGFHPDDTIPSKHKKLEERRDTLTARLNEAQRSIKALETIIGTPTAPRPAVLLAVAQLPSLRAFMLVGPSELRQVETNLHALRATDPIFVSYTV